MTPPATLVAAGPAPPPLGRRILPTGASEGIGRATAERLADAGHLVFAATHRAEPLQAPAATHPGICPVVLDVTDPAAIDRARQQITDQTGGHGLDVLINAAGILVLGPVEAVSDPQTRAQFEVNLFGALAVTRALLSPMRHRRQGRIVNVSSIMGRFALPGSGLYAASKFALEAASDAMRIELAPFGVRVVLVEPGIIATPLYQRAAGSLPDDQALRPYRSVWPAGFGFPQRPLTTLPTRASDRTADRRPGHLRTASPPGPDATPHPAAARQHQRPGVDSTRRGHASEPLQVTAPPHPLRLSGTGGLPAGRCRAARPPSPGRWPTGRPGMARPPSSATQAVSCWRCAALTQRPTWRSRDAASTDPTARGGTTAAPAAAGRQAAAAPAAQPDRPAHPLRPAPALLTPPTAGAHRRRTRLPTRRTLHMTSTLRSPTAPNRQCPEARAGLVVIIATTLVGGATGSLGGATTAVIFAAVGLLWGTVLTLATSLPSRTEPRRRAWAAGLVFATVLAAGLLTGGPLFELLVMQAALSEAPSFFAELVRPPIGDAIVLPFYLLNTPLEWLLVPATLLLTWRVPRQRRLVLAAALRRRSVLY